MGLTVATLNGKSVTSARVDIPAWGCWYATVSLDSEETITGAAELKVADLTLKGTILSGGPEQGRSTFRIVGGAGGWGRDIPQKGYGSDAGVRLATVIGDAAREVGETLATPTGDVRVGPSWTRQKGHASRILEQLAPNAWYVDELGVTHLGARAASTLPDGAARTSTVDLARGTVELASDSIAAILPGVVVDGLTAIDVCHELSESTLRSTVWGARSGATSRMLSAFRKMLDQLDPDRTFRGIKEYRVVTQDGNRLNLQPVRVSTGLPNLPRVPVRPGMAGFKSKVALGCNVLVQFVDDSPGRPIVTGFADADSDGFTPQTIEALVSDLVTINGAASFVALSSKVDSAISTIQSSVDAHVHPTGVGPSGPPAAPIGPLASVASNCLRSD